MTVPQPNTRLSLRHCQVWRADIGWVYYLWIVQNFRRTHLFLRASNQSRFLAVEHCDWQTMLWHNQFTVHSGAFSPQTPSSLELVYYCGRWLSISRKPDNPFIVRYLLSPKNWCRHKVWEEVQLDKDCLGGLARRVLCKRYNERWDMCNPAFNLQGTRRITCNKVIPQNSRVVWQ